MSTPRTTTSPTSTTPAKRAAKPGADIADVIAWVEAGQPADAGQFHSATRDGDDDTAGRRRRLHHAVGQGRTA